MAQRDCGVAVAPNVNAVGMLQRLRFERRAVGMLSQSCNINIVLVAGWRSVRRIFRFRDRLFWIVLMRTWAGWRRPLALVKPETEIAWHRKGWRL